MVGLVRVTSEVWAVLVPSSVTFDHWQYGLYRLYGLTFALSSFKFQPMNHGELSLLVRSFDVSVMQLALAF
jgi:hypothetical protein